PWRGMDQAAGSLAPLLELAEPLGPPEKPPKGTGPRRSTMPLIEIARAKTKEEALAGLVRARRRGPAAAADQRRADTLVAAMRGRSSAWYRSRVNLQHVGPAERPPQAPLEVDYDAGAGLGERRTG